jgi:hypothetical protein
MAKRKASRQRDAYQQGHEEEEPGDGQCHSRNEVDDPAQLTGQRCRRRYGSAGQSGDSGKPRVSTCLGHHGVCLSVDEERPAPGAVAAALWYGFTFACQHGLIHGTAGGNGQDDVGGHPVTRSHDDCVTRDQFTGMNPEDVSVPTDGDVSRQQRAQFCGRVLGTFLLDVGEDPVDDDHYDDGDTKLRQPSDEGECSGAPQHQCKKMRQLAQELPPLWR